MATETWSLVVAIIALALSILNFARSVWVEARRKRRVVRITISQSSESPGGGEWMPATEIRRRDNYIIALRAENHSEARQFIQEAWLSTAGGDAGDVVRLFHAAESDNIPIDPGQSVTLAERVDPTHDDLQNGFVGEVYLGTGTRVESRRQYLDRDLLNEMGYTLEDTPGAREPNY